MMESFQTSHFFSVFTSVILWGAILGAIYDLFRLRRIAFAKTHSYGAKQMPKSLCASPSAKESRTVSFSISTVVIFIEDILFALIAGGIFCILLFAENDGIFRWYALFGYAVGFFAYQNSIGKLVMRLSDVILGWIRRMIRRLCRILFSPLARFGRFLFGKLQRRIVFFYYKFYTVQVLTKMYQVCLPKHGRQLWKQQQKEQRQPLRNTDHTNEEKRHFIRKKVKKRLE